MEINQQIEAFVLNAFVDGDTGGNPAGVVLNADSFTNLEKQRLAARIGLSETAFISASNTAAYKLDFFTPTKQIAHCGHATIAAFSFLSQRGLVREKSSKETIDGNRTIFIKDHMAFMEQLAPKYQELETEKQRLALALGIDLTQIAANAPVTLVNTGNSFIIVQVNNREILNTLTPDFDLINEISEQFDLIGLYNFQHRNEFA